MFALVVKNSALSKLNTYNYNYYKALYMDRNITDQSNFVRVAFFGVSIRGVAVFRPKIVEVA